MSNAVPHNLRMRDSIEKIRAAQSAGLDPKVIGIEGRLIARRTPPDQWVAVAETWG